MTPAALFASGRAADLLLVVMAIEALYLLGVRRRAWRAVAGALAPGVLLVLALRAALTGAPWWQVALYLAVSLPVHLADLRWRRLL